MKKNIIIISLFFVLIFIFGCTHNSTNNYFSNDDFYFECPQEWTLENSINIDKNIIFAGECMKPFKQTLLWFDTTYYNNLWQENIVFEDIKIIFENELNSIQYNNFIEDTNIETKIVNSYNIIYKKIILTNNIIEEGIIDCSKNVIRYKIIYNSETINEIEKIFSSIKCK
jgi:hypothetical protein